MYDLFLIDANSNTWAYGVVRDGTYHVNILPLGINNPIEVLQYFIESYLKSNGTNRALKSAIVSLAPITAFFNQSQLQNFLDTQLKFQFILVDYNSKIWAFGRKHDGIYFVDTLLISEIEPEQNIDEVLPYLTGQYLKSNSQSIKSAITHLAPNTVDWNQQRFTLYNNACIKNKNLFLASKHNSSKEVLKNIFGFLGLVPKTQVALKGICATWRRVVDEIPWLFYITENIPKNLSVTQITMTMFPIASSGDIYHNIAAIQLALRLGNKVPINYLTEDNEEIKTQVKRAKLLTDALGFNCFTPLHVDHVKNYNRPSAKQTQLEKKLIEKKVIWYLDSRLSTSLISSFIARNDFNQAARILRIGFKQYANNISITEKQSVDNFVNHQIENIKKSIHPQKPLVIIHNRCSNTANKKQDLSTVMPGIVEFLQHQQCNVIIIHADSSRHQPFKDIVSIQPFTENNITGKDLGKICHMALLLKLYEETENFKIAGIIGNTSGTLDLAAFIGFKVLNLHSFSRKEGDTVSTQIKYQDWRVLLQQYFMNVINIDDVLLCKPNEQNLLLNNISKWLYDQDTRSSIPLNKMESLLTGEKHFSLNINNIGGIGEKGFSFFNSAFSIFHNGSELAYKKQKFNDMIEIEQAIINCSIQHSYWYNNP